MIPKHLQNCFFCPHQRIQHREEDGKCMIGVATDEPCFCIGFTETEADALRTQRLG